MMVNTISIFKTPAFWAAVLQAVVSALVIFQTSYPQAGWIGLVLAIAHAVLPTKTTTPVSLSGGTKYR